MISDISYQIFSFFLFSGQNNKPWFNLEKNFSITNQPSKVQGVYDQGFNSGSLYAAKLLVFD